jgi:hypothetical protein
MVHLHLLRTRRNGPCAAPGLALNQALFGQLRQGPPNRDTRHTKLPHQSQLARQTLVKTALAQLLAQHQIDLVVLGQRKMGIHDCHGGTVLLSCQ